MHRTNTIAHATTERWSIWADCIGCRRQAQLDLARLPPSLAIADLKRRLRCDGCGARQAGISIVTDSRPWPARASGA